MTIKPFNLMIDQKRKNCQNFERCVWTDFKIQVHSSQGIEMSVDSDIQLITIVTFTTER